MVAETNDNEMKHTATPRLRVVPSGPDRAKLPAIAVDPGFLPTTRQMALAVADRLTAYVTPYAPAPASRVVRLPAIGRELRRRALPPELAEKARLIETRTEGLRLALARARVHTFDYRLIWRRNIAVDAQAPPLVPAGATVIGQYGGCLETFKRARVLYGRTVLDYPIACVDDARELLDEEARLRPDFADTIDGPGLRLRPGHRDRIAAEVDFADVIVVGSRFAAASFAGAVEPGRLLVLPYGVDVARFSPDARPDRRDGPLRVLFAGQVTQRKGIGWLLDAMRLLDPAGARLTVAGPLAGSGAGLRAYDGLWRHAGAVHPRMMPALYRDHDVLVLPSIVEGSALVVLEAMASGLPVVVTANAGADAVRDGVDGFVVPLRSAEAIAGRLEVLRADPALLARMGAAAAERARAFTWEAFRRAFRRALGYPVEMAAVVDEPKPRELSA